MTLDVKARAARIVLRSAATTWSYRDEVPRDCADILAGKQIAVIAFWHFQMLPLWYRLRTLHPAAIVSRSSDGEILTRYLTGLGYENVLRGSSSKGGRDVLAAAVVQLTERSLLVTPDGPRGPARAARPGAMLAALRAGVPLVVAGWSSKRSVRFRSWDRMEAPLPFTSIRLRFARFDMRGLTSTSVLGPDDLARFGRALDEVSGMSGSERTSNVRGTSEET